MLSLTISMLMTVNCMFPLHQGTLLQHWMVYSHVWPLSSHGCRPINWNWTQIKLNSSLLGTNDSGANTSLCFPLSFLVSKLTLLNLLVIYLIKISPFAHMYKQFVAHAFTISEICGVFAVTLIWIVQNYLQLLSCPVVSIVAIHFCLVLLTLTTQGFSVYRINWPAWWQSPLYLLVAFHCSVPFIGCQ